MLSLQNKTTAKQNKSTKQTRQQNKTRQQNTLTWRKAKRIK